MEESSTYETTPIMSVLYANDASNDVILTNHSLYYNDVKHTARRDTNFHTETQNSLRCRPVLDPLS